MNCCFDCSKHVSCLIDGTSCGVERGTDDCHGSSEPCTQCERFKAIEPTYTLAEVKAWLFSLSDAEGNGGYMRDPLTTIDNTASPYCLAVHAERERKSKAMDK